ncbi:MAG: type II secretion system F family protein [Lachnospiraceae bacterium]|nr:type II secretion system F family protein [Lachnospiraceae bacterium]
MDKQTKIKPLTNTEIAFFCGQISLILQSGISSVEGITIMLEDASSSDEKAILQQILDLLSEGTSLYDSLSATGLFPQYLLNMVNIGEETGTLDDVMSALSDHYEREAGIKNMIKNAVTYPLLMIGMMFAVILILVIKVMPVFNQVFIQLGTEMSGFSRGLMNAGNTISRYSFFFLLLLLAIAGIIIYLTKTISGKNHLRNLGYHLPFIRPIYESTAACRFAGAMALTLSSGLNPERCLELAQALNDDPFFQKKIDACCQMTSEGTDLSDAFSKTDIFTGMYARLVSLGQKTGAMDQTMKKIAGQYQDEIDTRINHGLSIIEPTLVILLSLIVGIILLSVMLPLLGILSGI